MSLPCTPFFRCSCRPGVHHQGVSFSHVCSNSFCPHCLLEAGLFAFSSFQPSAKSFQNTFFHMPRLSNHLEQSPSPSLDTPLLPWWTVCSLGNAICSKSGPQTGEARGHTPKPSLSLYQQVSILCLRFSSLLWFLLFVLCTLNHALGFRSAQLMIFQG